MQTNNITVTSGQIGWIVGVIGIICSALCLAMIWTTRDIAIIQASQLHWLQGRVDKLEADADLWKVQQYTTQKDTER